LDGRGFVVTPAGWRANFVGGAPAVVRHGGQTRTVTGTLVDDPAAVADTLQRLFDAGHPPRTVGLAIDDGHRIDAADVVAVRGAIQRGSMAALASSDALPSPRSSVMRVSAVGAIAFTVMPYRSSSIAAMTVKVAIPALAAP